MIDPLEEYGVWGFVVRPTTNISQNAFPRTGPVHTGSSSVFEWHPLSCPPMEGVPFSFHSCSAQCSEITQPVRSGAGFKPVSFWVSIPWAACNTQASLSSEEPSQSTFKELYSNTDQWKSRPEKTPSLLKKPSWHLSQSPLPRRFNRNHALLRKRLRMSHALNCIKHAKLSDSCSIFGRKPWSHVDTQKN